MPSIVGPNVYSCRFSNSMRLLRYSLRCYAQAVTKQHSWSSVFNPHLDRNVAVKRFKQQLYKMVEENDIPAVGSLEVEALKRLIQKFCDNNAITEKSIRALHNLVLQRRINDDHIYTVIRNVNAQSVVNVSIPKKITYRDHVLKTREACEPFLKVQPEAADRLNKVLNTIKDQKKSNEPESLSIETFDRGIVTQGLPDVLKFQIDIKSLRKYLKEAEIKTEQRRKYAWDNQKRYNWEERLTAPEKISAGRMFFANAEFKRRKKQGFTMDVLRGTAIEPSSHLDSEPKELLIYNLGAKSKQFLPSGNDNSIFNINYKDLFGVINSAGCIPEEALSIINSFEVQGWKLVGDLYDNSESLVFQRVCTPGSSKSKMISYNLKVFSWASLLLLLSVGTISFFN